MTYVLVTEELAQDFGIASFRLPSIAHFGVRYTWPAALAAAAREGGDVEQAPGETPQSGGEAVTPNPLSPSRGNKE